MAIGNTVSVSGLRPQMWQKQLFLDAMDLLFFKRTNMMGEDENNIIRVKTVKKGQGATDNFGITVKMGPTDGVSGDNELEGRESAIVGYSQSIVLDQFRTAVRLKGRLDEQKAAYNMRMDAKSKLATRLAEFIEMQIFLKLGGVTNPTLTDVAGNVLGYLDDGQALATWSNSPTVISNTDTNAGYGARYLCADYSNGATSLATTDLMTPEMISRAKVKALTASPRVLPLRVDGREAFVMFIHPWVAFDLRRNAEWNQAQRDANIRGEKNPIFSGAIGIWDGVIIHEHPYCPFLDISVAGHNFGTADAGTDYAAVDCFRSLLCGRSAAGILQGSSDAGWVEETFDYQNKVGFSTSWMAGINKIVFNSKEYGVITIDTSATSLV